MLMMVGSLSRAEEGPRAEMQRDPTSELPLRVEEEEEQAPQQQEEEVKIAHNVI